MIAAAFYRFVHRPIRNLISVYPSLYLNLRRAWHPAGIIGENTELVIEGYPRSGNSFAEAAFVASQVTPRVLAHHSHAAAQVLEAARRGLPCLVLLRDPLEAGRSLCIHHDGLFTPRQTLSEWIRFYSHIEPKRDAIILARFVSITGSFGAVIAAVNSKFGTDFDLYDPAALSTAEVFKRLDATSRERGTVSDSEPYSPFASEAVKEQRETKMRHLQGEFDRQFQTRLGRRARELFERLDLTADI